MENCPKCGAEINPYRGNKYQCRSYYYEGAYHQSHECKDSQIAALQAEVERVNQDNDRLGAKVTAFIDDVADLKEKLELWRKLGVLIRWMLDAEKRYYRFWPEAIKALRDKGELP
jgi:hypothetical protein